MEIYTAEKLKYLYLAESTEDVLGIYPDYEKAELAIKNTGDHEGIITKVEFGKTYPDGIGVCKHWHLEYLDQKWEILNSD